MLPARAAGPGGLLDSNPHRRKAGILDSNAHRRKARGLGPNPHTGKARILGPNPHTRKSEVLGPHPHPRKAGVPNPIPHTRKARALGPLFFRFLFFLPNEAKSGLAIWPPPPGLLIFRCGYLTWARARLFESVVTSRAMFFN